MYRIDRIRELRHSRHEMELSGCYVRLDCAHPEVAGTASRKNIAERKRAEIRREAGQGFRKADAVVKTEIRSPIHLEVVPVVQEKSVGSGRTMHDIFFHEQIDDQARPGR